MEDDNQIIIDVPMMDALIASLQELQKQFASTKDRVNDLNKMLEEGTITQEEYDKAVIENTQQQRVLRQEMAGVEKQIQNEIKAEKAQEGSLVQLRAQLANLNKQYDSMSGIERMGESGRKLQEQIKGLSDKILNLEGNTGRWQRNVGNYQSALQGLSGGFKAAGLSTAGLDKSMKLLNANPIILFLTAIVAIFTRVKQAFNDNEQATMELNQSLAAFGPTIDGVKKILEILAKTVVNVVTKAIQGLTTAIGWLLDKARQIGEYFGKDWDLGKNFRNAAADIQELRKAENDYIKAKREWSVESAKIDREVADLREKAADKEQYNAKQRLEFLDRAIALETEKAAKDKEFAEQNLRNLQMEAQRTANNAEMNDKLAEAERAVIEADTRLSETKRSLSEQRQSAVKEINGLTDATNKYKDAVNGLREALEQIKMLTIDEYLSDQAKNSKELAASLQSVLERIGFFDQTISDLPDKLPLRDIIEIDDDTLRDSTTKLDLFAESYKENADKIEQSSTALQSCFGSVASMYKAMADDETKTEEERAAAAKKAKTWSALQIAANAGTALAKGVASAVDVGFPAAIPAILTMTAAVLSAITQAKQLASDTQGYETGGVIGGFHGASMGHDDTMFMGRRGEMIMNASQQRRLFEIANGNVNTNIAAELAAAIRQMPAPVVEYSELQRFGDNVAALNEMQKLK